MKKEILITLMVGGFFAFTTIGCGQKYTPLTQEQITAQADSLVTAGKDAKMLELSLFRANRELIECLFFY